MEGSWENSLTLTLGQMLIQDFWKLTWLTGGTASRLAGKV